MTRIPELRQRMLDRLPDVNARWCDIRNADGADGQPAVIRIYDEIHWLFGVSAEQVARDLDQITASEIRVEINSPGGDVFDGIAIYNALRAHPARVVTRVDGIAASAASVIVQAGDHRVMLSSAQMMIHEAWGIAIGPAADHREMADLLDKQNDIIAGIYGARSGREASEFRNLMVKDTYLSDQETLDLGLADEIVEPPRQNASGRSLPAADDEQALTFEQARAALLEDISLEDRINAAVRAAFAEASAPDGGGNPSAGQREDEPPGPSEASTAEVDQEQADRLLAELTFNKEN